MRAVVVSAWEPWRLTDGAVWILHHHLRWLAERHDVTVLAAGAPALESAVPRLADGEAAPTLPSELPVRWFGTDRSPLADYAARWMKAVRTREPMHLWYVERPALVAALRDEVVRRRPDVVHAFGWGTAGMWRHSGGVPVVHVAVDAWHRNAANRRLPGWRRFSDAGEPQRIRAHEARHYPNDAAVVVVAPPDAEELRAVAPSARIEVVPNGVDAGPAPVPLPADPVLGFHGSFVAQHNVDAARVLVEEVLPRVRAAVPRTRVLLAGRSPGPEVLALAGSGVEVRADVADVRPTLDEVAVYVAPLVSGWGIKNKVLEAMAAGRPVVTTTLGVAGIGAASGIIAVDGPKALADQVVALLRDRSRLEAEGAAGRQRAVTDFTWSGSAERIEGLWRDVAGRPARR